MAAASDRLTAFHEAMSVFLGACDGPGGDRGLRRRRGGRAPRPQRPAAAVAAHHAGLRARRERAHRHRGPRPGRDAEALRPRRHRRGEPQERATCCSRTRCTAWSRRSASRRRARRVVARGGAPRPSAGAAADLRRLQLAFGMTREDEDVLLAALAGTGKPAVGSMGDDTPPAAMLDRLPRRLEDHFKLRFAQETSPPIDPIRDSWVFETRWRSATAPGCGRDGKRRRGPVYILPERILSTGGAGRARGAGGRRAPRRCSSTATRGAAGPRGGARRRGRPRAQPRRPRRRDRALRPRRWTARARRCRRCARRAGSTTRS